MKSMMKNMLLPVFLFLFAFTSSAVRAGDQQVPRAYDRDGLEVAVTKFQPKDGTDKTLRFAIALHNIGENDLMLNLGMMLANGKKQYPNAIHLTLLDKKGIVKELTIAPLRVAGRVDDYIVPLGVNATHTVVVSLDQFWCPATKEFSVRLPKGTYKIVAVFEGKGASHINLDMPGLRTMQYWMGKAVSEPLEFIVQ